MADKDNSVQPRFFRKRKATREAVSDNCDSKRAKQEKPDDEEWISSKWSIIGKFFGMKGDPSHKGKKVAYPRIMNLCDLPSLVLHHILQFISVEDLENLAKVNLFFENWICGDRKTSADIPLKEEDIKKMREEKIIEKKPLIKLRCKDPVLVGDMMDSALDFGYILNLQVSVLDFSKLRELDLVPSTGNDTTEYQARTHVDFCEKLLQTISKKGTLGRIEKFDVLVDEKGKVVIDFVSEMTKLRDFGLNILTRTGLKKVSYNTQYLPMLESAVSSSRAELLRLNVIQETRRRIGKKRLKSEHIRRLEFTGPCSFGGVLLMPNLEVVEVDCGKECTNKAVKTFRDVFSIMWPIAGHNAVHAVGKCGLMAASIYKNCTRIKKFAGISLDGIDPGQSFKKWNVKVKKLFYKEYVKSCRFRPMVLELKDWSKSNWFTSVYPPVNE